MKPLRKRHLQIWTAWAILLPVGIISAYIVVPKKTINKLLQPSSAEAFPVVIKTVDKTNYTAILRANNSSTQLQLEWKNKTASIYPSSLIYQLAAGSDDIKDAGIVGRVEARGDYYFPLKTDSNKNYRFVLYDVIHQQKIDSLNF
jgi:hypothetical protein